jgi:hypothetical protein
MMDAVVATVRQSTSSEISNYLDDILQKHRDPTILAQDLLFLLERLEHLGFLVNRLKSDLTPSQDFVHLGMHFLTHQSIVKLPLKRFDKILGAVQAVLSSQTTTPRVVSQVIGTCMAAAELIPLRRLRVRPLQWALTQMWSQSTDKWDDKMLITEELRLALHPWTQRHWMLRGVPLLPPTATISLCTDASAAGWGAHLLPEFQVCSGLWSPTDRQRHINELEMLAVYNALNVWRRRLQDQAVILLSDNSTVVAYLKNQGGTRSHRLYHLTSDVLLLCDSAQIHLTIRHIRGRLNVLADGLSRTQALPTEWTLHLEVFREIQKLFPQMEVDLFATRLTRQLPVFVSPVPDPLAMAVDGLALDWTGMDL